MECLGKLTVFAHLDDRELATIVQTMHKGRYYQGDTFVKEGYVLGFVERCCVFLSGLR